MLLPYTSNCTYTKFSLLWLYISHNFSKGNFLDISQAFLVDIQNFVLVDQGEISNGTPKAAVQWTTLLYDIDNRFIVESKIQLYGNEWKNAGSTNSHHTNWNQETILELPSRDFIPGNWSVELFTSLLSTLGNRPICPIAGSPPIAVIRGKASDNHASSDKETKDPR